MRTPTGRVAHTAPLEDIDWVSLMREISRHGLTLPSAAQWEYACRAGSSHPWHAGKTANDLKGYANVADQHTVAMWSDTKITLDLEDGHATHSPAGHFAPNRFGLHDMHGSVAEWCLDSPAGYIDECPCKDEPYVDFVFTSRPEREVRGGSWRNDVLNSRSARREWHMPHFKTGYIGARLARVLDDTE